MIFEQIATGGCQSYLVGCPDACVGVLIDPELRQIDRYLASASREGMRIRYLIDTHTHADHFSASGSLFMTSRVRPEIWSALQSMIAVRLSSR